MTTNNFMGFLEFFLLAYAQNIYLFALRPHLLCPLILGNASFTPRVEKAFSTRGVKKAVINLRPHIVKGCISDPPSDFVPLNTCTGRSAKYGLPVFRCSRGTCSNESLLKGLSQVLGGHRTALQLANSVMVVYNHRRNHRTAGTF